MNQTRKLARDYRQAMGKPLAVSNELAIYDAARLLGLDIVDDFDGGYDAVGRDAERKAQRYQIKARAIFDESKSGQRIGQVKMDKEWDAVLLIIMDDNYEPREIFEASRDVIKQALDEAGDSKRAKRGAMSVAKFKKIGNRVWAADEGTSD
ncbi:MAG: hypothetical protein HUJ29_10340 [Gammaproteobacteria bacterium]|nr:hypothetical protein [Gammaproteobacteria bacterium]